MGLILHGLTKIICLKFLEYFQGKKVPLHMFIRNSFIKFKSPDYFFVRNLAITGFGIKRKEGWRRKCSAAAAAATQAARRTVPYLTFTTPKPSQAEGVH